MDTETQNRVLSVINSSGLNNLFLAQAKKADSFFKPRILVAINDRCLMTFNIKGTKVTNQFSWLTTKYIGRELNKLRFQFDKVKFAFESTEEALFRAVLSALQNILTNSELKAIRFDQFRLSPVISYPPSSVLNRIRERAILLKEQVYDNTLESIKSILIYSQRDVNIIEIPGVDKFLSIILDSLPFWSNIQTLSISEMGVIDPYKVTLQYAPYFNSLKLLELNCKKSPDFQQFMKRLSPNDENETKRLQGLSFTRSEFEKDELNTLQHYIIEEKIQSLELHDAVSRNTILYFYTQFLSANMMKSLTILNLDHTKNIANDISVIVPKCSNLLALSLADCGIEVSECLFYLSRLPKLRILNLSNNTCRKIINGLPPSITTLYLNSVNWCFQTLQLFLTNLPRHHLTLFLANVTMQQTADYDDLFVKLPAAKSNFLTGLCWDGNRIEQGLFDFLGKNRSLRYLSLSNCFSKDDEKEVLMFQAFLTQFHTLKKLIVQGSKKKYLGNLIEPVINGILKAPQIEFLDITQNESGDFGLTQMRRLLSSHTSLQSFIFDRTKPTNFSLLSDFLRDSLQYRNIHVSFPVKDAKSFLKKDKITNEEYDQLESLFITDEKPECVFIQHDDNNFPRFFTASEIEELKKPVVDFEDTSIVQQNQQQASLTREAESPRSSKMKNTSYNVNYGTLNMKAIKSATKNDYLMNKSPRESTPTKSIHDSPNQNDYLMKQNRKIAKMTPKESEKVYTFDSEADSYNQMSSSNDFFIPNNDFEAQTVKNRPIRSNLKPANKQGKATKTRRTNKAASMAPVKKRKTPRKTEAGRNDDDEDGGAPAERQTVGSARKTRKTARSTAGSQRPKTTRRATKPTNRFIVNDLDDDDEIDYNPVPKSTKSRRTTAVTSSSRKRPRRAVNNDDGYEYNYDEDEGNRSNNVRPPLRNKKPSSTRRRKTNRQFFSDDENEKDNVKNVDDDEDIVDNDGYDNENDDDDDDNLLVTYQIPSWEFPIKMKFVYDTDVAKKVEEKYSNNAFVTAILNENDERPRQKRTVRNRRK